jgi:hypothetical protein
LKPALALAFGLALAGPALARDPQLAFPLDCTLGSDCFVQNYVDEDPGPGAADFTCGPLTNDGHDGTDIALISAAQMRAGVQVHPALPGTVRAVRDGMEDIAQSAPDAPDVKGRECGNGVVIASGAYETQYCHMKKGSIAVKPGDRVRLTTVLGEVGLSGLTEFAHLHFALRVQGKTVDPFHPENFGYCNAQPGPGWWSTPLAYRPGGLVNIGFGTGVPTLAAIMDGLPPLAEMPADAPAIVLWAQLFGGRAGDEVHFIITGPAGAILDKSQRLDRTQARLFRAMGLRVSPALPPGDYLGRVTLSRDGVELERQETGLKVD